MIRFGVLGTADIALRRFLPASQKSSDCEYHGIASRDFKRTQPFVQAFGGQGYRNYEELLADNSINAVYIPLPPALHHEWVIKALKAGKHVLVEKPATVDAAQASEVAELAQALNISVHVNYMYAYHAQLRQLRSMLTHNEIGEVRGIRIRFGFPVALLTIFVTTRN